MQSDLLARLDGIAEDVKAYAESARADLDAKETKVREAAAALDVPVDPSKMPERSDLSRLDAALAHLATVRMHVAECRHAGASTTTSQEG